MGGAISGITQVEPIVSYHHQPSFERVFEALEKGDAEGIFNLNPSTDFQYVDVDFDRSLGGARGDGDGIGGLSWYRGGSVVNGEDLSQQPPLKVVSDEEPERIQGIPLHDPKLEPTPSTELYYSGKSTNAGSRMFPCQRDPSPEDIAPCSDKTISYFLAAAMVLTKRFEYLRAMYIAHNKNIGGVAMQFWLDGKARIVLTDDFIPCFTVVNVNITGENEMKAPTTYLPIHRTKTNDLWLPLLEKCFAKLYGSYRKLHGGNFAEVMRDMTGEVVVTHETSSYTLREKQELLETVYARYKLNMVLLGACLHDVTIEEKQERTQKMGIRNTEKSKLEECTAQLAQKKADLEGEKVDCEELKVQLASDLKKAISAREDSSDLLRRNKMIDPEKDEYHQSLVQNVKRIGDEIAQTKEKVASIDQEVDRVNKHIADNNARVEELDCDIMDIQAELKAFADGHDDVTFIIKEIYHHETSNKYYLLLKSPCPSRFVTFMYRIDKGTQFPTELEKLNAEFDVLLEHWVPWDTFHDLFKCLYVCHLTLSSMPPRFTPGFFVDTIFDKWEDGTGGGGSLCVNWRQNPMYRLYLNKRPELTLWRVRINLSLYDGRANRSEEGDALAVPCKYIPYGFTVLADDPLLTDIIAQTPYTTARDVSVELKIQKSRTLIIIPSTYQPDVHMNFLLSVSIQCDMYPRGFHEDGRVDKLNLHELHHVHEAVPRCSESHLIGKEIPSRHYEMDRSKASRVHIDRISGFESFPYSTTFHGSWNSTPGCSGPFADKGTAAGRIGEKNVTSCNNPVYRLRLHPDTPYPDGKKYVHTSVIIVLGQKIDLSANYRIHRIICYVLTPRGLVQLTQREGHLDDRELLGTNGFLQNVTVTRRIDCRMCKDTRLEKVIKKPPSSELVAAQAKTTSTHFVTSLVREEEEKLLAREISEQEELLQFNQSSSEEMKVEGTEEHQDNDEEGEKDKWKFIDDGQVYNGDDPNDTVDIDNMSKSTSSQFSLGNEDESRGGTITNSIPQRNVNFKSLPRPPMPPVPLFTKNIENVRGAHLTANIPITKETNGTRRGSTEDDDDVDGKVKKSFVLPDEKIYRELLLMPATWKEGEEGEFDITVWTNVPVRIDQVQKNNCKDMKRYLRR